MRALATGWLPGIHVDGLSDEPRFGSRLLLVAAVVPAALLLVARQEAKEAKEARGGGNSATTKKLPRPHKAGHRHDIRLDCGGSLAKLVYFERTDASIGGDGEHGAARWGGGTDESLRGRSKGGDDLRDRLDAEAGQSPPPSTSRRRAARPWTPSTVSWRRRKRPAGAAGVAAAAATVEVRRRTPCTRRAELSATSWRALALPSLRDPRHRAHSPVDPPEHPLDLQESDDHARVHWRGSIK